MGRRKHQFGRGKGPKTVPYYDAKVGRVVQIPPTELPPGVLQAQIEGIEGLVWLSPKDCKRGPIQHPPFDEEVRRDIQRIQEVFAEHRPISVEEWEDEFRRDGHPEREIALWSHAADVYTAFTANEPSPERRRDVFRVVATCLVTPPNMVSRVLKTGLLNRAEANQIVSRFYGSDT